MLALFALIVMRSLPFELAAACAEFIVWAYLALSARARRELRRAQAELGRFPAARYARRAAFNLALMARMGSSFSRALAERAVIEGEEVVRRLHRQGASAVVAMFHFGPWELLVEPFAARGYRVGALVGRQRMRLFDRSLAALRRRAGLVFFHTIGEAANALRRGFFIAALLDKTRRAKGGTCGVPYSGYTVSMIPQRLAERSRTPLVPVVCFMRGARLCVRVGEPNQALGRFFAPFFAEAPFEWLVWGE